MEVVSTLNDAITQSQEYVNRVQRGLLLVELEELEKQAESLRSELAWAVNGLEEIAHTLKDARKAFRVDGVGPWEEQEYPDRLMPFEQVPVKWAELNATIRCIKEIREQL